MPQKVQMKNTTSERICVGVLSGGFGVHGAVRLKSFCAIPEGIADYDTLGTENGDRLFKISDLRPISGGFSARLAGVTSKEEADALRGVKLYVARDCLPRLHDDEFYHADLIGLAAYDTGGQALGVVRGIYNHGAGDILEIAAPTSKKTLLLPFTKAIVPTVDVTAKRLVIDLPDGLDKEADGPDKKPNGSGKKPDGPDKETAGPV